MSAPSFPQSSFSANSKIFDKGDAATKLFIIESGEVEIFDPSTHQIIAKLGEGDAFGEQAILVGGIRGASARATSNTVCMEITTVKLREMLKHEEGLLRPTIEALLLQLAMHNEVKALSKAGLEATFEVSKRFTSTLVTPMLKTIEPPAEFTIEEQIKINKAVEAAKSKIILKDGDVLSKVFERLKKQKEDEVRAQKRAASPKDQQLEEAQVEANISMEDLPDFLNSEEAKSLPTKDSLYLKLLSNKSLDSTAFSPGQKIYAPGDQPNKAFIITSGEVSMSSPSLGFCTLKPGSVIGLAEGLSDKEMDSSTTARGSVIAISLPVVRSVGAIRASNSGLMGIARMTVMRIMNLSQPPSSLSSGR